jgi:uncharacterized membrane protein
VKHRTVLGLIIVLTAISAGAPQAQAGLRYCNQGKVTLHAATGYTDRQKGWVARGWKKIEPGECVDALAFPLDNRFYYYFAAGRDGDEHVKYTGEHAFCIESRGFRIYQGNYGKSTDEDCAKDGLRSEKFRKIDVQGKPEFTVNFGGPDNPPGVAADPPPTATAQPAPAQQPAAAVQAPVVRQPPPATMQQPAAAAEAPAGSADPSMPPPRRRQQPYYQEGQPGGMQQQQPSATADPSMEPPRRRQRYYQEEQPGGMQRPPSASADPSMDPPRRRPRYNQEDPAPSNAQQPAPPAGQSGAPSGAACQRFPNLC